MTIDPEGLACIALAVKAITTIIKNSPLGGEKPQGWVTLGIVGALCALCASLWTAWHGPALDTPQGALTALLLALSSMAGAVLLDNVAPLRAKKEGS